MERAIGGAIFDCDGTLLDTMGLWLDMEDELAALAGHVLSEEEKRRLRTCTVAESAAFFHDLLGVGSSRADVAGMLDEMAVEHYRTRARPRPGAVRFLAALRSAGVPCSVASSSPHSMLDAGMASTGLTAFIPPELVVSTDDVGVSKREPAAFDRARELMGSPLASTWVFEDSAYALECAARAGYRTVGVWDSDESGTFGQLRELADIAVRSFEELDPERLAGELPAGA